MFKKKVLNTHTYTQNGLAAFWQDQCPKVVDF